MKTIYNEQETQYVVMGNADLEIGTVFGCGCANCG
jgi:hypothetical protein